MWGKWNQIYSQYMHFFILSDFTNAARSSLRFSTLPIKYASLHTPEKQETFATFIQVQ